MSIARAFTKRIKRQDELSPLARATGPRCPPGTINRNLISLPTELISTTNVHALNAPDIRKISSVTLSSDDSISSGNESDFSTIDKSFLGTDSPMANSSPITPLTPASESDGHDFFNSKLLQSGQALPVAATPAVPQRSPSHSKKAHVELSRSRSRSGSGKRMSPPPTAIPSSPPRTSFEMFGRPAPTSEHPFGRELAQVSEVAEEFGAGTALLSDEERELVEKGLCKFSAHDYLDELMGVCGGGVFNDQLGYGINPWM